MRIWQSRVPDGARFLRFAFFKTSETIALARVQMVVGLVEAGLTDVAPGGRSNAPQRGVR